MPAERGGGNPRRKRDECEVGYAKRARLETVGRAGSCAGTGPRLTVGLSAHRSADSDLGGADDREGVPDDGRRPARALTGRPLWWLVSLGLTPSRWPGSGCGTAILEVTGRRSGGLRALLVTWVEHDGERYLVTMPGQEPQWVKNMRAAGGEVALRHGNGRSQDASSGTPGKRTGARSASLVHGDRTLRPASPALQTPPPSAAIQEFERPRRRPPGVPHRADTRRNMTQTRSRSSRHGPAFALVSGAHMPPRGIAFEPWRRYGLAACTSHASAELLPARRPARPRADGDTHSTRAAGSTRTCCCRSFQGSAQFVAGALPRSSNRRLHNIEAVEAYRVRFREFRGEMGERGIHRGTSSPRGRRRVHGAAGALRRRSSSWRSWPQRPGQPPAWRARGLNRHRALL